MTVFPEPLIHSVQRPIEALARSLPPDVPSTFAAFVPVVGEAQKVKGSRLLLGAAWLWRCEWHQARFLRVQAQAKLLESFEDDPVNPLGIAPQLEAHDKIIGVSNQKRFAAQHRFDHLFPPAVQHFMQVDVTEERTNHSSLRSAFLRVRQSAFLHDSSFEPFAYQP